MAPEPRDDELPKNEPEVVGTPNQEATPPFEKRPLGGDTAGLPPYNPKDDPDAEPAAAVFAAPSTTSGSDTKQLKKRRFSKKKAIIAGVLVVLLLLVSGAAATYALWWNNPDKVLADAMRNTFVAESGTAKGSLKVVEEDTSDTTLTFDVKATSQTLAQVDGTLSTKGNGQDLDLNGSLVVNNKDVYVKFNDIRELIEGDMGTNPFMSLFDDLIDQVDGKWVAITDEDIEELQSSEFVPSDNVDEAQLECVQGVIEDFRTNDGEQQQVMNAYQENTFVFVEETLGSENIEGRDSNHYLIGFDEAKGKAFGDALVATDVFKQLDECSDGELSEQVDEDDADEPEGNTRVELWVDRWSHQPTKVLVSDDTDGTQTTFEAVTDFTATPEVTVPEADTTISELLDEIERIQQELFNSFVTPPSTFEDEASGIGA